MFNFEYQNTTKIIFGKDQISALTDQIDPSKKILMSVKLQQIAAPHCR